MAKRCGIVSSINNLSVDELVDEMFNNPATADKVRLYAGNNNMNSVTQKHASVSYKRYLKLKKERRQAAAKIRVRERKKEKAKAHKLFIKKWNNDNPKSFRYRTVPEILELIENDNDCYANALLYLCNNGSRVRSNPELIKRIRMAMIAFYIKHDQTHLNLDKHLNLL